MAGKIKLYDQEGKEVFFDFPVDAREAVATGRYFETESEAKNVKEEKPKEEKPGPGRKPKPIVDEKLPEESEEKDEK